MTQLASGVLEWGNGNFSSGKQASYVCPNVTSRAIYVSVMRITNCRDIAIALKMPSRGFKCNRLLTTVKGFREGSVAAISPLSIKHKLRGRRLIVHVDDRILSAQILVARFDVDVGVDDIVRLDHTFENKCPIGFRMADGCINDNVGVTCRFCEPDVRILDRTTIWPLYGDWNGSRREWSIQKDVGSNVLSVSYLVHLRGVE